MARQILIVDSSTSMRKILKTMILAEVNDAAVAEANDVDEAMERLQRETFHVVLFSRESSTPEWLDFIDGRTTGADRAVTGFVLFSSRIEAVDFADYQAHGVQQHLAIPCEPHTLAEVVTRACSVYALRAGRRYSLPGATATLEQGAISLPAEVINFSEGGLFCELSGLGAYNWSAPTMVTIHFPLEQQQLTVRGMYSVTSRLVVVETYSDYTPKRVRIAFRFITVPAESREKLEQVFGHVEAQEESFRGEAG